MTTFEDLSRWAALAEQATAGPWVVVQGGDGVTVHADKGGGDLLDCWGPDGGAPFFEHAPDAAFIAEARTAVPSLLAEVERLTIEHQRLQHAVVTYAEALVRLGASL